MNMNQLVKNNLSNYLEFNVDLLFINSCNNYVIFGGAIRDSLINESINDIDILCSPRGFKKLLNFFEYNGFQKTPLKVDTVLLYSDTRVVYEIHNLEKNGKVIQLIRPNIGKILPNKKPNSISDLDVNLALYKMLEEVDLSNCGVFYDGELKESIKDSIKDVLNKEFWVLKDSIMHNPNRIDERISKFEKRGWSNRGYKLRYKHGTIRFK